MPLELLEWVTDLTKQFKLLNVSAVYSTRHSLLRISRRRSLCMHVHTDFVYVCVCSQDPLCHSCVQQILLSTFVTCVCDTGMRVIHMLLAWCSSFRGRGWTQARPRRRRWRTRSKTSAMTGCLR